MNWRTNTRLQRQIHQHVAANKPVLAECGGMLYLNQSLTDTEHRRGAMCGVLDAQSVMQGKLAELGLVEAEFSNNERLRGHTFHYSKTESNEAVRCVPQSQRGKRWTRCGNIKT